MQHCVSRHSRPCKRPGQAAGHYRVPRFSCRAGQGQRGRPAEPHSQLECFTRQALIRLSFLHAVPFLSLHAVLIDTTASRDVSCSQQGTLRLTGCTFAHQDNCVTGCVLLAAGRLTADCQHLCTGASASKLVFLDPPPESLEHWQQLERALELLERQDTQHRRATLPAPGSDQFAPQTPDRQDNQDASSAPARSAAREGQLASQVAVSESSRGVQQRSGHSQRGREALVVRLQAEKVYCRTLLKNTPAVLKCGGRGRSRLACPHECTATELCNYSCHPDLAAT